MSDRDLFPDDCTIEAPVLIDNGAGGVTPAAPTLTTTACRFGPSSGRKDESAEQVRERGAYGLLLPMTTAIGPAMFVRYAGRRFRVVWLPAVPSQALGQYVGLDETR